jgi:hypothetical protein
MRFFYEMWPVPPCDVAWALLIADIGGGPFKRTLATWRG